MELDKQIEELKAQQQEVANKLIQEASPKILGSNPQWCFIQGKIEALTSVQEGDKKEVKK